MSDPELDAQPLPEEATHPLAPETPHSLEIDLEPEPTTPTRAELLALRRRRTRLVGGLAVVVWVLAACVFALGFVRHGRRHHHDVIAKQSTTPPVLAATHADPPPREPDVVAAAAPPSDDAVPTEDPPPPGSSAATSAPPAKGGRRGEIVPPPSAAGHRIYVDGHIVGEGTKPVDVACGDHTVRVGSHGQSRFVRVPCGGTITIE